MSKVTEFKESIQEILLITKTCLTSFWFWLPVMFSGYMYLQLWMIFYIHPLTLLIVPVILLIYSLAEEDRRVKAQYGLDAVKKVSASDPLGTGPRNFTGTRWNIEKLTDEYKRLITGKSKKKSSAQSE